MTNSLDPAAVAGRAYEAAEDAAQEASRRFGCQSPEYRAADDVANARLDEWLEARGAWLKERP